MGRRKPQLAFRAEGRIYLILKHCLVSTTPFGRTALIRPVFTKSLFTKESVNGTTKKNYQGENRNVKKQNKQRRVNE